ncbi:MAG: TolC family protein, partial [Desulfobacteraceae bacterium]|nr:TolC family protein [Desulfobacteraceae bacterium]
ARDAMKPDLSISAELGVSGYSPTDAGRSVKDISGDNYSARVKGTLMLPVKNTAARSRQSEVMNRIRQMEVQIARKEHEVEKTVQTLQADMETMRKRIALNEKVVSITDQNLRNETERLIAEKSTLLDTLQFQTDFSSARLSLVQSKVDYLMLVGTYRYFRREMETFTDDSLYGEGSAGGYAVSTGN